MCNGALAADLGTGTHHNILSQDAALDHSTCLDHNAIHQDSILNGSALFHGNACAQDRVLGAAIDLAALGDEGILHHGAGPIFWAGSTGLRL